MQSLFFTSSLLLTLGLLITGQNCRNGVQQRKEVRTLSTREWNNYVAAVKQVQRDQRGLYDQMTQIHFTSNGWIHNWPMFLPWHRVYLRSFELMLQRHNPSVTVPYWNWAIDSQAPEQSPVLSNRYFGGNGQQGTNCVMDGAFRDWRPGRPNRHCMSRRYNNGNRIGAFHSIEVINRIVNTAQDYDSFRRNLEYAPHGTVHNNIGADFATIYSPNDPLFYSHHAYIDKIWADLQRRNTALANAYGGVNSDGSPARLTDALRPFTLKRVADMMSTRNNCYVYADETRLFGLMRLFRRSGPPGYSDKDEQPKGNGKQKEKPPKQPEYKDEPEDEKPPKQPEYKDEPEDEKPPKQPEEDEEEEEEVKGEVKKIKADDRSELIKLRTPDPLPEKWCKMNCIPVEEMRKYEKTCDKVTDYYNSKPGYISKCSLWKREDLLNRLSKTGTTFCIEKDGKRVTARGDARKVKSKLGGYA